MRQSVGFIGLGVMGRPMAANLLKAGFPVVVHSRSRGPVDAVVALGAAAAASPADVAARATRIITMLPASTCSGPAEAGHYDFTPANSEISWPSSAQSFFPRP